MNDRCLPRESSSHFFMISMAQSKPVIRVLLTFPTVTWNVYAHLTKPTNQETANRLENTIFGVIGDQMVTNVRKGVTLNNVTP